MEYFVMVDLENFDLVKGLLNYIIEDVRIIPSLDADGKVYGMIFTISEAYESDWHDFYKNLVSKYVTFREIKYDKAKKRKAWSFKGFFREKNVVYNDKVI